MSSIVTFYVYLTGLTYIVLCLSFWWRESAQRQKLTDLAIEMAQLRQDLSRTRKDRDTYEIVLGDAVKLIRALEKERVVMVDVTTPPS